MGCDALVDVFQLRLEQIGDRDPQRVVAHLHRPVELEGFTAHVEVQISKGALVTLEELGRSPPHHSIQRRRSLLAVQQQLDRSPRRSSAAAKGLRIGLGHPHQEPPYRVAAIQRVEEAPHILASPHIAALKLRQGELLMLDVANDG